MYFPFLGKQYCNEPLVALLVIMQGYSDLGCASTFFKLLTWRILGKGPILDVDLPRRQSATAQGSYSIAQAPPPKDACKPGPSFPSASSQDATEDADLENMKKEK